MSGRLLGAGKTAAKLAALGLARLRGRRMPFSMTFILTHRCNFQCEYCNIPARAGAELTEQELRRAIDELEAEGLARVSFSGGEALLRRDAPAVIAHAKSRGLFTSLNSNAWLLDKRLPELAGVLDMLVVSLDGPEAVHDRLRRQPGSFARVVRALDEARRLGIATATITVLTATNLDVIDDVLAVGERHGAWAYFQPAYENCFSTDDGLDPAITPSLYADLAARLRSEKGMGRPVGASSGFLERLARGPTFGDCASCHAGRYFGTIMPDGTLVPCHLRSEEAPRRSGRELGFARAFRELAVPKSGPGCAISPYQETDLIFGLDVRAVTDALARLRRPRERRAGP